MKKGGVSCSVRSRNVSANPRFTGTPYSRNLGPEAILREQLQGRELVQREVSGLGEMSANAIRDMQGPNVNADPEPSNHTIQPDDGDPAWQTVPEDDEDFSQAIHDIAQEEYNGRFISDRRTWKQRLDRLEENWAPKISDMANAYLQWKHGDVESDIEMEDTSYNFEIKTLDLYTLSSTVTIKRSPESESPIRDITAAGFIANSPERPSVAVSIRTLELFLHIRKRKGSFSVEAFTKVLCDLYNMPYRRMYRIAFSNAFDAYLAVMRTIDSRVASALGQNKPDWRVLNECKACCYELEGEPHLKYRRMLAINANFSLKRVANHTSPGDTRVFSSDYYLTTDQIDRYADEVTRSHRGPTVPAPAGASVSDDEDEVEEGGEGDPAESAARTTCGTNWKAAHADDKKKMWKIFDESGIFACACCHGLLLWIADLVRSGELAKYPLSMVARALEVLGDRLLIGYDIGCAFSQTIGASSLGPAFKAANCRCCVNAFHGYSHSYECQKEHHPNVIEGMGLEDLETMERVFSASNVLGAVTRYMTAFRRRVFIYLFFRQWDIDKYSNLGLMLHNNYKQALQVIKTEGAAFEEALATHGITRDDLDVMHEEEDEFFRSLGTEPSHDVKRVEYVQLLQKYRELRAEYEKSSQILLTTPDDSQGSYESATSETRKGETRRKYLQERIEHVNHEILLFESALQIQIRWSPQSQEYIETLRYVKEREYHRALEHLQKLVIQRLFELQKLNLSYTGYRMQSHIAKALQRRCKAIRNAVKKYNNAAQSLSPPRPTLDWSKVSHYAFLEEFELLRGTRQDVLNQRWSQETTRYILKQDLRIKRAREEIERCNVEIRRVHTGILDEHDTFDATLKELDKRNDPIHGAVYDFVQIRKAINYQIIAVFQKTYSLEGFCGDQTRGRMKGWQECEQEDHEGHRADEAEHDKDIEQATKDLEEEEDYTRAAIEDLGESEDAYSRDLIQMVEYIAELPRQELRV